MRYKDPDRIKKIVKIIEDWRILEGTEPTITQIAEKAGMGRARVHAYLKEMDEQGIITYSRRHYNTPKTEMINERSGATPIVGSVKCGDPELEEAEIEEYVRLPETIFGDKSMYILRARGDSMVDAGIDEGDFIVVENTPVAAKNDIVVAMDDDNQNTLKRYKGLNKDGNAVLAYENDNRYPNEKLIIDKMRIQGIARFVIKRI
jgi:repressor LexA